MNHKCYRILLVDDEIEILNALRYVFRRNEKNEKNKNRQHYEINTASDGLEALDILSGKFHHLVIVDQHMPRMNGAELLRRLREIHPETIRIMLTGYGDSKTIQSAVNEGYVYQFLLKPWQDEALQEMVCKALQQYELIQSNKNNIQKNIQKQVPKKTATGHHSPLFLFLKQCGVLDEATFSRLHKIWRERQLPAIKLLLDQNIINEQRLFQKFQEKVSIQTVSLHALSVDPRATQQIPRAFCEQFWVIPIGFSSTKHLLLAVADPLDLNLQEDLRFLTGMEIEIFLATPGSIISKVNGVYGPSGKTVSLKRLTVGHDAVESVPTIELTIREDEERISLEQLSEMAEETTVTRLVNLILVDATRRNASDIHIQSRAESVVVRYRIDGILYDRIYLPLMIYSTLVSRVKIMAKLDIADRRMPQDGRVTIKMPNHVIDMRVSIMPTIHGEKVVMRLLDRTMTILEINDLGFSKTNLEILLHVVAQPQGILLTTGPTGSGKTTTLYALLKHGATDQKNYITLEDPVEFYLEMATQVPILEKIHRGFAASLRAALRQDPDVILVGEIRDIETAEVTFQAALTGHFVFTSLHTSSAVETVARLLHLGLKPYTIAAGLTCVISQRLVRKICLHCRELRQGNPHLLESLGPPFNAREVRVYSGRGCEQCHYLGYRGRVPVHEMFVPDEEIRDKIVSGENIMKIQQSTSQKTVSLMEDAFEKVVAGWTTPEEVLRVLGPRIRMSA